ncbi:alpha/beta hydrolase [Pseudomonas capeferrum]|uniref:alpha/beta hydrolase n=1 Tax=Pseudomonas capeferrum TaxID=1495066 RepID=UPI0015E3A56D|nr:alpha/beta hydrolase [Pseudomonas capeferrum]MBA1200982.1 alpha/beta hydrolase [Pseudomonas capeferrum]
MSLHPDLAAFLELVELGRASGKILPMHELGVEQARREFELSAQLLDPDPPCDLSVTPLAIQTRDGAVLQARLYRPAQAANAHCPVILYLHGGGYVVGSLDSHDTVCRRLALASGHAVLAPAYRLAPEHRFPTALQDVQDTTDWLVRHAHAHGLDSARTVFAGDSAGATLATLLAITAATEPSSGVLQPCAQLLFYPVADASTRYASYQTFAEGYLLESATMDWFYQHYLPDETKKHDWRVSPMLAPVVGALAPAYVSVAQYDPLHDEGIAYAEYLRRTGTRVELIVERGLTHDFLRMSGVIERIDTVYGAVAQWLRGIA